MSWRLMWHPKSLDGQVATGKPTMLVSEEVATDAEARALVRKLKIEGVKRISVTAAGLVKIMSGSELQRWLDRA